MNNWFAAAAAGVLSLFGSTTVDQHGPRPHPREDRGSTTRQMGQRENSATGAVDLPCVLAAVSTRESALGTASSELGTSVTSAYSARASALASAYAQTDKEAVKASVKTAWSNFAGAMKASKKGWQSSREGAWQTFRTAIKSCGAGAMGVADSGNAGTETSGQ